MQPVQPEHDAGLVVQHRVAQAVVESIQVAAEVFGEVHRLDDGAQHGRTAAGRVAVGDEQRQTQLMGSIHHGLLVQPFMRQRPAPQQLLLQGRLAIARHA
ncbi:hypothetical protein G6F35_018260 [Rhizopus arrhizus]|nr:hypothetical protein G6F35_018260 [Rhizopus arrhizus]